MRRISVIVAAALVLTGCGGTGAPVPTATGAAVPPSTATPEAPPTAPADSEPAPTPTATPEPTEPDASAFDLDSASSLQVVVNKRRPLHPPEHRPELVAVSSAQEGGELVRPELDEALTAMSQAMRAEIGEGTFVFSSYRGYERQAELYAGYVARYGQAEADTTSARPGHSEHQTGLAVDVSGTGGACRLATCFGDTAAGRWLAEHAWEHGFVVRYPRGLEHITGYEWEPWHLRYVGVEVSTAMHESGAPTLEEFFGLEPAPDYG